MPDCQIAENKLLSIFLDWINNSRISNPAILEIGCGIGNYSLTLAESGYSVTAVDIDYESLLYLKNSDRTHTINIICADVTSQFINNKKFDIIIASEVLEHLYSPHSCLNMIRSMLHDDGFVFITIPNGYGPWEIYNHIQNHPLLHKLLYFPFYFPVYLKRIFFKSKSRSISPTTKKSCTLNKESPHVQFWTFSKFMKLAESYGFKLVDARNSNVSYSWMPYYYRLKNIKFDILDCKIADYLPRLMVSGWIFKFKKCT